MVICELLRLFYDMQYRPLFNFFLRYTNFVSREKYALFQYSKKWILYWLDNFPNHKILSKKYKTFVKFSVKYFTFYVLIPNFFVA